MSKATAAKEALDDHRDLMDLIEILKNIASNRFYKKIYERLDRSEIIYFLKQMFRDTYTYEEIDHLVADRENAKAAFVSFTADGGFMGNMTSKVVNGTVQEAEKYNTSEYIIIGKKGFEKLKPLVTKNLTYFAGVTEDRFHEYSIKIKDHLMKLIRNGKINRVFGVYPYALSLNVVKNKCIEVFPPMELINDLKSDLENDKEIKREKRIFESNADKIIENLCGVWMTHSINMMFIECSIAGFAFQAQQLENSYETLTKMEKKMVLAYRKAKRTVIDNSLREAFCSTLMKKEA